MFLSDLNYLQDDIIKTKKATNISDEDLSKLYSMTVRVALPKWIANKIDTSAKFIYPFLSQALNANCLHIAKTSFYFFKNSSD